MIVDGKKIAKEIELEIKKEVEEKNLNLKVVAVVVGFNDVIEKFVSLKKRFAESVSISFEIKRFDTEISQEILEKEVSDLSNDSEVNGIIIQLPLPSKIDTQRILNLVPENKDIDVLSSVSKGKALHPVVGSVKEILNKNNIEIKNKKAVVVGRGKLVGIPVSNWLENEGVDVCVFGRDDSGLVEKLICADIVVSGVGKPGLIKAEMLKDGVVLLDAGSSEQGGVIIGDCDLNCTEKASLFSRSPGGIGPITIAVLFKNLLELNK